jgi:hypothetical protein
VLGAVADERLLLGQALRRLRDLFGLGAQQLQVPEPPQRRAQDLDREEPDGERQSLMRWLLTSVSEVDPPYPLSFTFPESSAANFIASSVSICIKKATLNIESASRYPARPQRNLPRPRT